MAPKTKKSGDSAPRHTFNVNDVVLAKMSGYPYWPALVVDESKVPSSVLKLKRPGSRIVQFMPAADYGFVSGKDMKPLSKDAIKAFLDEPSKSKSGKLFDAYKTAEHAEDWRETAEEMAREIEEQQRIEAEAEDELDEDEDKPAKKKKSSSGGSKAVKKASGSSKKPKDAKKADTGKKRKADGSAKDDEDKDDKDELDPASKQVKGWRHELQRNFLGKDGVLKDKLDESASVFETLEKYEEMTVKQLQDSKIGKVLKKIVGLKSGEIPQESEDKHKFKERAEKLHNKWQEILAPSSDKAAALASEAAPAASEPDAKKADAPTQDTPASDAPAAAPSTAPNGTAAPAEEEKKETA